MRKYLKIAFCGDVCPECPRYIATQSNNILEFKKIAELWCRLGFRDKLISPEELKCTGCSKDIDCAHQLNNCEYSNGKSSCGECDLFPCDKINAAFQKTEKIKEICRTKCTDSEYEILNKAFLMKRQILAEINANYKNTKK